jgi:hypothetical protein
MIISYVCTIYLEKSTPSTISHFPLLLPTSLVGFIRCLHMYICGTLPPSSPPSILPSPSH